MDKIKNLSLKKTLMLYLSIALTCSFFLSAIVISIAEKVQTSIWYKYIDIDEYYKSTQLVENHYGFHVEIPRVYSYDSDIDYHIVETCDFIVTWTALILSTLSSAIAVLLFYKNKLKKPLEILENSSKKISENRLDFLVEYDSKDEMGRLCNSFEHMRAQLEENNKNLWKMIEEQKILRAAIAHDIRAPLAVLQGYHEMMLEFVPEDKIGKEKLIEMLVSSEGQVERLKTFVDTMRQLSRIEEREVKYQNINIKELEKQLVSITLILIGDKKIDLNMVSDQVIPSIQADQSVILEAFENIVTNAIRYATTKISISIEIHNNSLQIGISDDGKGFNEEEIEVVTKAYYHDNPSDELSHFGLGLYLCKLLCEKHKGKLLLANEEGGGACVKTIFAIN